MISTIYNELGYNQAEYFQRLPLTFGHPNLFTKIVTVSSIQIGSMFLRRYDR